MSKTIAIASGKGGTGKSFFTINLGVILAENGAKVLLIDADTGAPTLDSSLDLQKDKKGDFLDILLKEKKFEDVVLQDNQCENLYLIPGSIAGDNLLFEEEDMQEFCKDLKEKFDYILLDCPSGSNLNVRNVIRGVDEVILLVLPNVASTRNADILITKLMKDDILNISFVLNRVNERMVEEGDMLAEEDVVEIFEFPLLGSLPEDDRVTISLNNAEAFVHLYPESSMTKRLKEITGRISSGLFYKFMIR